VIRVRDSFLRKQSGLMLPSHARLILAPATHPEFWERKILFWDNVYGVDMSALRKLACEEFLRRPVHTEVLKPSNILSTPQSIWDMNMYTVTVGDLEDHSSAFSFDVLKPATLHCLAAWFDVAFLPRSHNSSEMEGGRQDSKDDGTWYSTSPYHEPSHWKHALLFLEEPPSVYAGDKIHGSVNISRNKFLRRHFQIKLVVSVTRADSKRASCMKMGVAERGFETKETSRADINDQHKSLEIANEGKGRGVPPEGASMEGENQRAEHIVFKEEHTYFMWR